jgi:hypothetical protein
MAADLRAAPVAAQLIAAGIAGFLRQAMWSASMSNGLLTSYDHGPSEGAGLVSPPRCDRRALSEPPPVLAGGFRHTDTELFRTGHSYCISERRPRPYPRLLARRSRRDRRVRPRASSARGPLSSAQPDSNGTRAILARLDVKDDLLAPVKAVEILDTATEATLSNN